MKAPIEDRIRELLREKNLTITELAERVGCSRVALYHVFRGHFSSDMLNAICRALGVSPHVLLEPIRRQPRQETDSRSAEVMQKYQAAEPRVRDAVDVLLGISGSEKRRPVVLVVDDIEDNAALIRRYLRKDFEVMEFTDPREALRAAETTDFDAIVSDQRMPGMTGSELLTKIGAVARKDIAKVIVSAYLDNQALMDAINRAKADAFFLKPYEPAELRNRLHTILASLQREPADLH